MKQNYKYLIFLLLISFMLTGCFLDPYKNEKYGVQVIEAWFSYKNGEDDLGKTRKTIEDISSIDETKCDFIEKYKSNYVFKCQLTYKKTGETIIPFAKELTMDVYAVFTPEKNNEFTYKVYNSKSEENVWKTDKTLK